MTMFGLIVTLGLVLLNLPRNLDPLVRPRADHAITLQQKHRHAQPDRMPIVRDDSSVDRHMPMYNGSDFATVDKQPVPLKKVQPEVLETDHMPKGTVWVRALVDTAGKVKDVKVIKSDALIFNDAAIAAAKQWAFKPAELMGEPVETWVAFPLHFGSRVRR